MENRFKHDIKIEQLEKEYQEFKDAAQSLMLIVALLIVLMLSGGVFI